LLNELYLIPVATHLAAHATLVSHNITPLPTTIKNSPKKGEGR